MCAAQASGACPLSCTSDSPAGCAQRFQCWRGCPACLAPPKPGACYGAKQANCRGPSFHACTSKRRQTCSLLHMHAIWGQCHACWAPVACHSGPVLAVVSTLPESMHAPAAGFAVPLSSQEVFAKLWLRAAADRDRAAGQHDRHQRDPLWQPDLLVLWHHAVPVHQHHTGATPSFMCARVLGSPCCPAPATGCCMGMQACAAQLESLSRSVRNNAVLTKLECGTPCQCAGHGVQAHRGVRQQDLAAEGAPALRRQHRACLMSLTAACLAHSFHAASTCANPACIVSA